MRLANKRGFYITNSRLNALLNKDNEDILDSFCFENPKDISKERMKEYLKAIKTQ